MKLEYNAGEAHGLYYEHKTKCGDMSVHYVVNIQNEKKIPVI